MEIMEIQCAKKEHAVMLSELIYSTEKDPEAIWGYGSKEEVLKRLTKLVKRTDTRYSYKYARVAIENGRICGAMIGLPHNKLSNLDDYTGKVIFELQQGVWGKLRWFFTALRGTNMKESESGEYYIANLATFSWARGKGIATKLMLDAEKTAQDYGLTKCSLLVDQEKPAVVRLYAGLGYEIKEEVVEEQKYYRMIKPLEAA
ncbi:MAG TPA: GNAT family N-acetyltransferase [Epulopiscium sp.]|nr:GNAT family N-acetyltransferase [Candidatus Epulonipiscium sp.]